MGGCGEETRQVRLLCPWARHLTGRPTLMWKTGDPEMATPKRVRTSRPKHSDTSLPREWRIKNKVTLRNFINRVALLAVETHRASRTVTPKQV